MKLVHLVGFITKKNVHRSIQVMNVKALLQNGTEVILILCMFSVLLCVLEVLNRMQ